MLFLADEESSGHSALYVAVGSLVGAIVTALTGGVIAYMRARHDIKKEDTISALAEYRKLLRIAEVRMEKMERRVDELEGEIARCRKDHHAETQVKLRILMRMEQYELLLRRAGVDFAPFDGGDETLLAGGDE